MHVGSGAEREDRASGRGKLGKQPDGVLRERDGGRNDHEPVGHAAGRQPGGAGPGDDGCCAGFVLRHQVLVTQVKVALRPHQSEEEVIQKLGRGGSPAPQRPAGTLPRRWQSDG